MNAYLRSPLGNRTNALLVALVVIVVACGDGSSENNDAPVLESPVRVLFIGDSITAGLDGPFEEFSASTESTLVVEAEERGAPGTPLEGLWHCCRSRDTIRQGNWRYVVVQGSAGTDTFDESKFLEYARLFREEIDAVGAEMVLYMNWEHRTAGATPIGDIADIHTKVSNELGVKVAPVGLAWAESLSERPDLELHAGDRVHPNSRGTYLALAVFYATLIGKSPEGATYSGSDLGDLSWVEDVTISDDDAAFLRRIAWETVSRNPGER